MRLRRFHPIYDLPWYNSWLASRDIKPLGVRSIPGIGFVAINYQNVPISAIFLRKVEGGIGMVDGLCTNPDASKEERFMANDMLIERILKKAKGLGMTNVLAWSVDSHTLMRSVRHGFKQSQFSLLTRDLSIEVQPWDSLETYSAVIREQDLEQAHPRSQTP